MDRADWVTGMWLLGVCGVCFVLSLFVPLVLSGLLFLFILALFWLFVEESFKEVEK